MFIKMRHMNNVVTCEINAIKNYLLSISTYNLWLNANQ